MNKKGFTLIEVLLAVFIISVAVLGLYNGINYSYHSVETAKEVFTASYLAEEGVELVKNIRDSNFVTGGATWNTGLSKTALWIDANGAYNYVASGEKTIFSRKIVIANLTTRLKVTVTVFYGEDQFILEQYLYDWK